MNEPAAIPVRLGGVADADQPNVCRIRVGNEWREWTEGKCLIFDDSFEHEVVYDATEAAASGEAQDRIVLLLRFWHPDIFASTSKPLQQGFRGHEASQESRWYEPIETRVVHASIFMSVGVSCADKCAHLANVVYSCNS